jgi:DNA-binding beta-propeller fold protein YncE
MLPDGDHLLFTVAQISDGDARWERSNIVVESLSTHTRTVVIEAASDGRLLSTGHLVFAREGMVFAVPFDANARRAIGDPTPVIEGVRRPVAGTTGVAQFAVSASGSLVYLPGPARMAGGANRVLAISTREGVVTRLPVESGRYVHTRVSPDGKQVAVGSDDGKTAVIWIYPLGSTAAMRRLVLPGRNEFPIWSPDGKQLAFLSDGHGDRGIFVQSADGTGAVVRLTTAPPDEMHIPEAWSPNGQHLVFAVRKGEEYALRVLDRTTQQVSPVGTLTSREPIGAVFSPDGKWLAVAQSREGGATAPSRGVYVQRFPSGELYQAPRQALDFHATWSARGNELIYVTSAASGRLAIVPVQTSPTVQFGAPSLIPATVTGARVSNMTRAYDVMPDGRFIGIVSAGEPQDIPRLEVRVVLNWLEELKQRMPLPQ